MINKIGEDFSAILVSTGALEGVIKNAGISWDNNGHVTYSDSVTDEQREVFAAILSQYLAARQQAAAQ